LHEHYWAHRRWFFGLFIVVLLISLSKDLILSGQLTNPVNLAFHFGFITLSAIALATRSSVYHKVLAVAAAATFCVYIIMLFARLR